MPEGRASNEIDWVKVLAGAALLGGAWWAYEHFTKQPTPQPQPGLPPSPGPSPNPPQVPPAPGLNSLQAGVKVGDGILVGVSNSSMAAILAPLKISTTLVQMVVKQANPGSESVWAAFDDPQVPNPEVFGLVWVPRAAIVGTWSDSPIQPPTPVPNGGPAYLSDPMSLEQGKTYRARLQLGVLEGTLANADAVKAAFQGFGFSDVAAYEGVSDLPPDWPSATTQGDQSRTWYLEGTWSGASASVPKDPRVVSAWVR